jgi:hypothetical protein
MTALADGTYLILNGGQQGRAGFGLATRPNHNAVLYDPSKPVNQRMSVMANTTIDRLYHSEAILLQDGRVLVTGSDPEDERFPQEYRVEVFVPPYLLNGNPRPVFTIANTDWAYGESITITLTSSTSGTFTASLLGAESSTHGNSMGQRTLLPAITCSGNTCTITAPPNANVCPPGWFQLFLLRNGTPSISTYVRIGGDPAGLGNWPDHDDFKPLPGVYIFSCSLNFRSLDSNVNNFDNLNRLFASISCLFFFLKRMMLFYINGQRTLFLDVLTILVYHVTTFFE